MPAALRRGQLRKSRLSFAHNRRSASVNYRVLVFVFLRIFYSLNLNKWLLLSSKMTYNIAQRASLGMR